MNSNLTIKDVAEALGVSATTVSRVISGKGRISQDTRNKVLSYVEQHNFTPNRIAQGLAQKRTGNICVLWPGNSEAGELPFLQKCLLGISEAAEAADYDVLITLAGKEDVQDVHMLRRVVENQKADGIILTRTLVDDAPIRYLQEVGIPFVAIGNCADPTVLTVDADNEEACLDLMRRLIASGLQRIALIGADENYVISQTRLRAFQRAFAESGGNAAPLAIYMGCRSLEDNENAMRAAVEQGADAVVCMDDGIAASVLTMSHVGRLQMPEDLHLVSFYDSTLLENASPSITAIRFDDVALGQAAAELLLARIQGEPVESRVLPSYQVMLRESFCPENDDRTV